MKAQAQAAGEQSHQREAEGEQNQRCGRVVGTENALPDEAKSDGRGEPDGKSGHE